MKLTVIGFWGGYPKKNAASAGYLLEHEGFQLLIDCGSGVLSKLQNVLAPEELDAVILSHYHPDHIADIGVLQHARLIQGFLGKEVPTLPIYGHSFNKQEFSKLTYKNITKGVAYDPSQLLTVGPFNISFLKTDHPVPCYAMKIEAGGKKLVYTADSAFKEEFIGFSIGADVLLCECNFYGGQDGKSAGHMNSIEAGQFAQQAAVHQLILTHLPHYGNLSDLLYEASREFTGIIKLADEFLTVVL
ncbi:MBL fold metallo-hydrolase [Bacillus thermocopriae]|uniref:MBL fold metallo-hydrolase n=1 Tax=Neobacillus thermocopriae TaxID=1215031 RepID=A0A6B3TQE3_9BACI|nr:MBL fold metallo-hydrolase [Neobacillus thermocopriae]MED3623058.1 MBL fold metallo-hydrolase [Neobacillus thermocopriae]MED3714953.1 MBL fold metallo-hydrolase [Neobacillus thermocopriae]NEX78808.1 MBL fold metallo-hydrolase [Neobacillus thermocopriae]